jgi:hypothetical protein
MSNFFPRQIYDLVFIFLFTTLADSSVAQYRPHPLLSSMWQTDTEYIPETQVVDTTLTNGFTGTSFGMRIPLYLGKDWLDANGGKPFYAVLLNAGASLKETRNSYLNPDRYLTVGKIGVTALMAKGLRNLYLIQVGAALPTEAFNFKLNYIRPNGALVWRHLYHNNKLWHTLGVTYSPIQGRDFPLPIAGFGAKLSNEDQIQFTFPFNAMYTHSFTRKFSVSAKLSNMGGYHYLKADTTYGGEPLPYRFNYRKLTAMARYYTDRFVVLTGEAGVTGRGRIQIADQKDRQLSSFYLRFIIQVRFGARPAAAPILNFDPGDSGFDPNYQVE